MEWLCNLIFGSGVAHSILVVAIVIAMGVILGKFKIFGISLGMTWILFVGIIVSHFGISIDSTTMAFVKDFGLILFVYCIGLQVGPGFFESFKKGGITMNLLAVGIILLNVLCCIGLFFLVFYDGNGMAGENSRNLAMMVGVLCGAITNAPGLGAATEACSINPPLLRFIFSLFRFQSLLTSVFHSQIAPL